VVTCIVATFDNQAVLSIESLPADHCDFLLLLGPFGIEVHASSQVVVAQLARTFIDHMDMAGETSKFSELERMSWTARSRVPAPQSKGNCSPILVGHIP